MRISNLRSGKPSGNPLTILHLQFTIDKYTASMVPLRVLSRTNLAGFSPSTSFTSSISFTSFRLRTLDLSLRSFLDSRPLFSITSALFLQNTRGGIPLRDLVRCTEAQKCLFVSPLLATLTYSLSRKSFPCYSYANTRDGGATVAPISASVSLRLCELCGESVAFFLPHLRNQQLTTNNCKLLFLARPLFSYSYELLFPQALSFDNHPHCPGGVGVSLQVSRCTLRLCGRNEEIRVLRQRHPLRRRQIGGLRRAACRGRRDVARGVFGTPGSAPARGLFRRCARMPDPGDSARRPNRSSTPARADIREWSRHTFVARSTDCRAAHAPPLLRDRARSIFSAARRFALNRDWDPARASLSTGSSRNKTAREHCRAAAPRNAGNAR